MVKKEFGCDYCNHTFVRYECKVRHKHKFCDKICKLKYFSKIEPLKHHKQWKKGNIPWNKGKKGCFSYKTLQKMSKQRKGREPFSKGKTYEELYGVEKAKLLREKNRQQALRNYDKITKEDTKPEKIVENYLLFNDILYIKQYKYKYGVADFWLPESNLIIEVDGEYWHNKPKRKIKDYWTTNWLIKNYYNVLRITDVELYKDYNKCMRSIENAI